jgi:hypothetical protein
VLTNNPFGVQVDAKDTCGGSDADYSGATLTPTRLTGASYSSPPTPSSTTPAGLSWASGQGTVSVTAVATEVANVLTVSDPESGISASSNAFDTVDTFCTSAQTICHWDASGKKVFADAPTTPTGEQSLGLGFNATIPFNCSSRTAAVGGTVANIEPRGYGSSVVDVVVTYKKSVSGSGPASSFLACKNTAPDGSGAWTLLGDCSQSNPVAPCVYRKRTSLGDLQITFHLNPTDPWVGTG